MTCKEIEETLSAYMEDDLASADKMLIEEHLASCQKCRSAFEDLKKARELVQELEEVEPPPWLKLRIMSRLRKEAERKEGAITKLFRSLYVKVPVTAFATVLVAVLAFYVYRASEPERNRMAPLSAPKAEVRKDQAAIASRKAPAALSAPAAQKKPPTVRQDLAERDRGPAAPPAQGGNEGLRVEEKEMLEPAKSDAAKSAATTITAGEKGGRKAKEIGTYAGAVVREERAYDAAPTAARLLAVAAGKPASIDVALHVRNASTAARAVEAILEKFNARVIEKTHNGGEVLRAEMKAQNVKEFFNELRKIGELKGDNVAVNGASGGIVTVRTEIVGDH